MRRRPARSEAERKVKYPCMSRLEKLISISTDALAPLPEASATIPRRLDSWTRALRNARTKKRLLLLRICAPCLPCSRRFGVRLEAWNAESLWRHAYKDLADGLLFFAEEVFQDQFCLSNQGVLRFDAETGKTTFLADSIEAWAHLDLSDYSVQTGWQLAHDWQALHGPLPLGKRLMSKMPFILGGQYTLDNLYVGHPLEGMSFKSGIAMKISDLPDGTKIRLRVID